MNINYAHEENNNPPLVGAQGIGFSSFLNRIPLTVAISTLKASVENPDGTISSTNPFNGLLTNPYYLIGRMFDKTKRDRLLGTVSIRYDFDKWLYLQGRVNADFGYRTMKLIIQVIMHLTHPLTVPPAAGRVLTLFPRVTTKK